MHKNIHQTNFIHFHRFRTVPKHEVKRPFKNTTTKIPELSTKEALLLTQAAKTRAAYYDKFTGGKTCHGITTLSHLNY